VPRFGSTCLNWMLGAVSFELRGAGGFDAAGA
jgi:hypothetical protein